MRRAGTRGNSTDSNSFKLGGDGSLIGDGGVEIDVNVRRFNAHDEAVTSHLAPLVQVWPLTPPTRHGVDGNGVAARQLAGGSCPPIRMKRTAPSPLVPDHPVSRFGGVVRSLVIFPFGAGKPLSK